MANGIKIKKEERASMQNMRGLSAEKWTEELWDELLNEIAEKNSKKSIKEILEKVISKSEKKMILRRLGVLTLVRMGKSYSEISEILWTSHATISTIKKNILNNASNYKSYRNFYGGPRRYSSRKSIEKLKKSAWEELFQDWDIWEIFKNPPRPPGIGLKQK